MVEIKFSAVFYLLVEIGLLLGASYYIKEAVEGWEASPTITLTSWKPLKSMKFPAMTVCPVQDSRWRSFYQMVKDKDVDGKEAKNVYLSLTNIHKEYLVKSVLQMVSKNAMETRKKYTNWRKDLPYDCDQSQELHVLFEHYMKQVDDVSQMDGALNVAIGRTIIDIWIKGNYASHSDVPAAIDETIGILGLDKSTNNTCRDIFIRGNQMIMLDFYILSKVILSMDRLPWTSLIQAFIIDLMTNREKYPETLSLHEWKLVATFMNKFTSFDGVPGSIMFDMVNMKSILGIKFSSWTNNADKDPDTWEYYDSSLGNAAEYCFNGVHHAGSFECNKLEEPQRLYGPNSNHTEGLLHFLQTVQQSGHFNPSDSNSYSYPMIPFCWFGGSLDWLGKENFTAVKNFNSYEAQYTDLDPSKLMKWCDVFQPAFPLSYGNCLTTKMALPEVDQVSPNNGFAFVLENYFGQNTAKKGVVSHKLYIHEYGILPDPFKIYEEGIDIVYGKKHDISLTASIFDSTENFNDLDFDDRQCLIEKEQNAHLEDSLLGQYSVMNCMMDKLVKLGQDVCNCTAWDIALFLNRTNDKICMNFDRICLEVVFNNASSYKDILEMCPSPCSSMLYSITSFKTSNLIEDPLVFTLPGELFPGFAPDYFLSPKYNNVSLDYIINTWPGITDDTILSKKRLDYMAMVSVNFGPGYGTNLVQDARVTFPDKLGNIGGTIGIFVGVSFLTLYEYASNILGFFNRKVAGKED